MRAGLLLSDFPGFRLGPAFRHGQEVRLRVPPLEANRYFVLLLDVGRSSPEDTAKALSQEMLQIVNEEVENALQRQGGDYATWARRLQTGICGSIEEAARRRDVRFRILPDPLSTVAARLRRPVAS